MTRHVILAGILLLMGATTVKAHRVKIFAAPDGTDIRGYAYLTGGGRLRDVPIIVSGPDGARLAALQTDGDGTFRFTPTTRTTHVFHLELADGHTTAWTVAKEELPVTGLHQTMASDTAPDDSAERVPPPETTVDRTKTTDPAELLRRELAPLYAQIHALREQQARAEDRTRLRDVLGGIGYLIGLTGIWAYAAARKRTTT